MFALVAALSAAAWAFAGWRNMPRLADPSASAAGVMMAGSVLMAWWAGTRHAAAKVIGRAVASAEARAESRAQSASAATADARQVVIVNATEGARAVGAAEYGTGGLPWVTGVRAVDADSDVSANIAADLFAERDTEAVES